MALTYQLIATVTVGSGGAANIEFTSIPATYTDLVIKYSTRDTTSGDVFQNLNMTFNNVGGTSYSQILLRGTGAAVASFSNNNTSSIQYHYSTAASATASTFANGEVYIPNYTGSNNKSVSIDNVTENNATTAYQSLTAGIFSSSSAITSIKLASNGANLAQYSTATLYGIKNTV